MSCAVSIDRHVEMSVCDECGRVSYPRRAVCPSCLSDQVTVSARQATGTVVSVARVHKSYDPALERNGPWAIGAVTLDAGPLAICFLDCADSVDAAVVSPCGSRVQLLSMTFGGEVVRLVAVPEGLSEGPTEPFLRQCDRAFGGAPVNLPLGPT